MLIQTIIEIAIAAVLIAGLFNEDKLAAPPERAIRRLKSIKKHNTVDFKALYKEDKAK